MTISVSELKARCLEVIREVEREGHVVEVVRRGKVVARILPASADAAKDKPWTRFRGSVKLLASPEESVVTDDDFEAAR